MLRIKVEVPEIEIDLECPKCKHSFREKLRNMKPGNYTICPSCKTKINFKGDDASKIQEALDGFKSLEN